MKEMAIEICMELRKDAAAGGLRDLEPFSDGSESYKARDFVNHLAILGWMCYVALDQAEDAVCHFRRHYAEKNQEIALYVLLRMVEHRELWALWLRTYHEALSLGVLPREELQRRFKEIQERQYKDRQNSQISE